MSAMPGSLVLCLCFEDSVQFLFRDCAVLWEGQPLEDGEPSDI